MATYKPQNTGLLSVELVREGDKVRLIEEAYSTYSEKTKKLYWNVKVELENGTKALAGIAPQSGNEFFKAWGEDTKDWVNKVAVVQIKEGKNGGYIVLLPTDQIWLASDKLTAPAGDMPAVPKEEVKFEYPQENLGETPF